MRSGDFSGLAKDYSRNRPDYSPTVVKALIALVRKKANEIDFADIGAGTGIFTRMVESLGVNSAIAIEPNEDMFNFGIKDSRGRNIQWGKGSAEKTGIESNSIDLVSMASSFHWADFDLATKEFNRILRPGGRFTAIWNPRLIEINPLLVEIEAHISSLKGGIKRVSSGRSGITETMTDKLNKSDLFEDVIYIEGRHVISMPVERYIGAWRSVNDLQVQLGESKFEEFIDFIHAKVDGLESIEATYLTRAWSAQKK